MSTQEPTQSSQNGTEQRAELDLGAMHEELKKHGVDPDALFVATIESNEMFFGEMYRNETYYDDQKRHVSIFERGPFVTMKNPKRFSRMVFIDGNTGATQIQLRFSDFDFINDGLIEVRPRAAFFLDWLDFLSQASYCKAYLNFIEGRIRARAAHAGIVPAHPSALANIKDLLAKGRKG
jgi:hypothetical protein